jgi:hypothetical protein
VSSGLRFDDLEDRLAVAVDTEQLLDATFRCVQSRLRLFGELDPLLKQIERLFEGQVASLELFDDQSEALNGIFEGSR